MAKLEDEEREMKIIWNGILRTLARLEPTNCSRPIYFNVFLLFLVFLRHHFSSVFVYQYSFWTTLHHSTFDQKELHWKYTEVLIKNEISRKRIGTRVLMNQTHTHNKQHCSTCKEPMRTI